jgi:hypothetical protein
VAVVHDVVRKSDGDAKSTHHPLCGKEIEGDWSWTNSTVHVTCKNCRNVIRAEWGDE